MIRCEKKIARALSNSIWNLSNKNQRYGTGYDFKDNGDGKIQLELMNGCAKYGNTIKIFTAISTATHDTQFIHDIVSSFEKNIFTL